jgi:hypothetical protein
MEFSTKEQLQQYLKEHPDADKSKHKVKPSANPQTKQKLKDDPQVGPVLKKMEDLDKGPISKEYSESSRDLENSAYEAAAQIPTRDVTNLNQVKPGGRYFKQLPKETQTKLKGLQERADKANEQYWTARKELQHDLIGLGGQKRNMLQRHFPEMESLLR